MGKVDDFEFSNDPELELFKDQIRDLLNYGKYQIPNVSAVPTWAGDPGETVWFWPASGGSTLYFYKNSAWVSYASITV